MSASASNSNQWRKTGGLTHAADQATYDDLVTNTLTVKSKILGDLSISGTIYADNIVAVSSGSLISGDLIVQENLTVQGSTQVQDLGVSGSLAVLDDAFVQDRLVLGPVVSAGPPPSSTSSQFLWSDGQSGIAIGAANLAPGTLPASLYISGANPNALVATTTANAGRNILAQTGPRKSGLAVETAGGTTGPAFSDGSTSLQFYDGSSSAASEFGGLSAVDDPSGSAGNTAGLTFGAGTLTVSARNLVLDGSTVALSRNTGPVATETRTTSSTTVPAALVVQSRPPIWGVSPVLEPDSYNEFFLAGRLRGGPNNSNTSPDDVDSASVPVFGGAPLLLRGPDANGHAHAFAGSADGTTGWRYGGGGPALDDLDSTRDGFLAGPDPTLVPTVGRTMEPYSAPSPSTFSGNKRSAAQAGFLEPELGRGGNAQFVPTLTQTQAPNRLQNRGLVAVNAPLAPAHNQRAFLANGPTQVQMFDASPLSLALPFVVSLPRATWDTVLLPDDVFFGGGGGGGGSSRSQNGRLGIVVGGPAPDSGGGGGAEYYPVYRTEDGGQTWTESVLPVAVGANVHFTPIIYGPDSVFAYAVNSFAFYSTDRGRTWTSTFAMVDPDPNGLTPHAYVLPGTNELYYSKGTTLYRNTDLTATGSSIVITTQLLPFTPTGLAGVMVPGVGGVGLVANLIAFSSNRNVLYCTRPAFGSGGSNLQYTSPNIVDNDGAGGYFGVAGSTLAGRAGDVVAVGVGTSTASSTPGIVMIVTLSADGGLSWPEEIVVPLGSSSGSGSGSGQTPATFSPASTVTWLHPSVIVIVDAAPTGNLAVSADRGRTWRFLSANDYGVVTANGLGAILGPRAALPIFCGVFRSTDLPHTAAASSRSSSLPPTVLVSTRLAASTASPAGETSTAAFALSLDSLAPEWSPLFHVDGSASVAGHMDVDVDLSVGGDATVAQTLFCNSMDVVPDDSGGGGGGGGPPPVLRIGAPATTPPGGSGGVAKTVVIGLPGDTILLQGNVLQQSDVDISGKVLTLNAANPLTDSAFGVGIQAFENGVDAAGFMRTGADRLAWDFKAPGSTTVARLAVADLPAAPADAMLVLWSSAAGAGAGVVGSVSGAITVGPTGGGGPTGSTGMVLAKNLFRRNAALSTDNTLLQAIDTSLVLAGTTSSTNFVSAPLVSATTVRANTVSAATLVSSPLVSAATVNAATAVNTPTLNASTLVSALLVSASTVSASLVSASAITATTGVTVVGAGGTVSAPTVSANTVSATTVSAATVSGGTGRFSGTVSAPTISATTVNVGVAVNVAAGGTVSAPTISATAVNAGTVNAALAVNVAAGGTVSAPTISATTVNAGVAVNVAAGGTVSAPTISATTVNAAATVSAATVSAGLVSATNATIANVLSVPTTVSAGLVSATTVSATTVRAGVVAVTPTTGIVQGGPTGAVPFLVSGAAQTQYEYFRSSAAAASLVPMIGSASTYAGAIGGSVAGGGAGLANDLAYVHLAAPVGDAKTSAAHTWLTNTGAGNGVPGLRIIAQLSRAGNLTLSAGDSGVTAGGGQLFAAGVNSTGTISGAAGLSISGVASADGGVSSAGAISGGAGLSLAGSAVVAGSVTAGTTVSAATVSATTVRASGVISGATVSAAQISATNISALLNITAGGTLGVAGNATVGGTLTTGILLANTVSATTVSANTVSANTVNAAVAVNGLNAAFTGAVTAATSISSAVVTATTLVSAPTVSATGTVFAATVSATGAVNAATVNASATVSSATVSANTMTVLVNAASANVGTTLASLLTQQQVTGYVLNTVGMTYSPTLAGLPRTIFITQNGTTVQFPSVTPANSANGYVCSVRTFFGGAGGSITLRFPLFLEGGGVIQTNRVISVGNNTSLFYRVFDDMFVDWGS